jgi:hypothetical protein
MLLKKSVLLMRRLGRTARLTATLCGAEQPTAQWVCLEFSNGFIDFTGATVTGADVNASMQR